MKKPRYIPIVLVIAPSDARRALASIAKAFKQIKAAKPGEILARSTPPKGASKK